MIPQDCPYSSTGERALEEDRGWGSTKREFLDAIFSEVPVHKLESENCLVFCPHFSVLQNAIHEKTRVLLFCKKNFVRIFKTREEYGFLKNPSVDGTVNSMEQKTGVFC
jgi:hypothetical protein